LGGLEAKLRRHPDQEAEGSMGRFPPQPTRGSGGAS